jgi:opacity protein-like surface antigen
VKQSLSKKATMISVTYSGGGYSNNLTGTNFSLEESEDLMCLSIDLSGNLRVRNKESNCYADALELTEQHSSMRSVQIDESKVVDRLIAACQRAPSARWNLKLLLGDRGAFKYSVTLKESDGNIFFDVC